MKRKDKLFIEAMVLAKAMLDELTEEEIQDWYGSDYYYEIKRFVSWEWRKYID